jgi:hypothetical protein
MPGFMIGGNWAPPGRMRGSRPETISARFRPSEIAKEECSSRVTAIAVLGVGGVYALAGSGSPPAPIPVSDVESIRMSGVSGPTGRMGVNLTG